MLVKLFALATIALTSTAYPLFDMCDDGWGKDLMYGGYGGTICK